MDDEQDGGGPPITVRGGGSTETLEHDLCITTIIINLCSPGKLKIEIFFLSVKRQNLFEYTNITLMEETEWIVR